MALRIRSLKLTLSNPDAGSLQQCFCSERAYGDEVSILGGCRADEMRFSRDLGIVARMGIYLRRAYRTGTYKERERAGGGMKKRKC
jgi:hypothetical protein